MYVYTYVYIHTPSINLEEIGFTLCLKNRFRINMISICVYFTDTGTARAIMLTVDVAGILTKHCSIGQLQMFLILQLQLHTVVILASLCSLLTCY